MDFTATASGCSIGSTQQTARRLASREILRRACAVEGLEGRTLFNAGGGWVGAGIQGSYYTGQASAADQIAASLKYTRDDVRIDFTSTSLAPGGSPNDVTYASVAGTDFSVRWQGSLIARYSTLYTFKYLADDTFVMQIAHHGQNDWQTVINQTEATGSWTSVDAPYAFTGGEMYDVVIDFSQAAGPWAAQLHWLSTGAAPFAEEAIEPATPVGVNYVPGAGKFADAMRFSGGFYTAPFGSLVATDANGWPTTDFHAHLLYNGAEYGKYVTGTYLLQFDGQAQVASSWAAAVTFSAGGVNYGATLPKGAGFDGTTTTATMTITSLAAEQAFIAFTQTQRNGGGAGLTNMHLWRPTTEGGAATHQPGTLFTDAALAVAEPFTTLRMMDWSDTNNQMEKNWTDRARPTALLWGNFHAYSWETAIAMANQTGKDIYINIPQSATFQGDGANSYIENLAKLFKYGSDGVTPYSSAVANPVWAPLNSNLNIYIEYSNETWNWNGNYGHIHDTVADNKARNTPDWQLFASAGGWVNAAPSNASDVSLWTLLRGVSASNAFRQVFGDAAMPADASGVLNPDARIRPLFEWQYDGNWNGGSDSSAKAMQNLSAKLARPLNNYMWGGGGGWYADSRKDGFADTQFANPNLDNGTAGWTFSAGASIVTNGSAMGNPNVPTDVNPASPAKSTTNAVALAPGASISQSVYFSGGYADITYYFTQSVPYDWVRTLQVYVDGVALGRVDGGPEQNLYTWQQSAAFNVSAGYHTVTFRNNLISGNAFIANFGIQTVNGLFNETTPAYQQAMFNTSENGINVVNTIKLDLVALDQFGLRHVGYEGGFNFNQNLVPWHTTTGYASISGKGYSSGGPNVGMYANLDPRAERLAVNTLLQYYQTGGSLPIVFQSDGNINSWGVFAPNIYSALTSPANLPKMQAVEDVGQMLLGRNFGIFTTNTDIGPVAYVGSARFDGSTYTVRGSGSDIGGTSDALNYLSKGVTGDKMITARVDAMGDANAWSKAGVMFRTGTAAGAIFAAVLVTPDNGVSFSWRSSTGAGASNVQIPGIAGPVWVRLARASNNFEAFYSTDGSTWIRIGTAQTITMSSATAGLAVTSHDSGALASATFSDVSVAATVLPAPAAPSGLGATVANSQIVLAWSDNSNDETGFVLERATDAGFTQNLVSTSFGANTTGYTAAGLAANTTYYFRVKAVKTVSVDSAWSNTATATTEPISLGIFSDDSDFGSPGQAGSGSYGAGSYSVAGGGTDIWNSSDQFHYMYKSVTGDQVFVARVGSITNTNNWAKAGVMFRDGTAADAVHVAAFVTPMQGVMFQWRTSAGVNAANVVTGGIAAPVWLKLVRSGDTFTAFYGANGTSWTQIGSARTIAMGSVTAGLAVTSHDNSLLNTATFTDVSLGSADNIAPTISSTAVNGGAAQRSMVKNLSVTFSEPVTLSGDALSVRLSSGLTVPNTTITVANPSGDQMTYTLTFSGTAVAGGSLADGIYDLIVTATGVQDLAGNPLTADYSRRFHRLFGDSDGNKVVNALDYARLKNALGRAPSDPLFNSAFDYEANNLINALDLSRFRQRYGLSFTY